MRGNIGKTLTWVVLFTVTCLVFIFILVTVFGQFRFDSRVGYRAEFTNVSGLKGGNFVRIAGVEIGKVTNMALHPDGTVTVDFSIDRGLTLTEGTRAAVRYENLIGDRYLSLEQGAGSVRTPGACTPSLPPILPSSASSHTPASRHRQASSLVMRTFSP